MERGKRLADDLLRAQLLEHDRDEDICLDVRADGYHAAVEVANAERPEHRLVLRIAADGLRDAVRDVLHVFLVVVDREDLLTECAKLARDRPAEAAETDYQKGFHFILLFILSCRETIVSPTICVLTSQNTDVRKFPYGNFLPLEV